MNDISKISGEFKDNEIEYQFQEHQWGQMSRQLRIVASICMFCYIVALYPNYLDLGANLTLVIVILVRLPAIFAQGWLIAETMFDRPSSRVQFVIFPMAIFSSISEAVELHMYLNSGANVDPLNVPFFGFIILIIFGFLTTRFWWTTYATLIGSVITLIPYAIGVDEPTAILVRHSLILFGIIAFGAGLTRVLNRLRRSDWLRSRALEKEIVERQRAEQEAIQANAVKDEFLASVSHELRNPLHAIIGTTKTLQADNLDATTSSRIALIKQASDGLLTQVNGLLDFVQFSIHDNKTHAQPVNLRQLVNSTKELMKGVAHEKQTNIAVKFDAELNSRILGDPEKIRQILLNLLSNAIKYGNSAPIRVIIEKREPNSIALIVEDDGGGVPQSFEPKLFDNFSRHTEHKYNISGIGLGLAISRKLAQNMKGQLTYEPHPKGARFTLTIPLIPLPDSENIKCANEDSKFFPKQISPRNILLVEDDPIVRSVSRDLLRTQGHHIREAPTAEAAIEIVSNEPVELILCDLNLPGMSGVEFIQLLRTNGFTTPAILLTANALMEQQRVNDSKIFDAVLIKPLSLSRLNTVLHDISKNKRKLLVNEQFIVGELKALDSNTIRKFRTSIDEELARLIIKLGLSQGKIAADIMHTMASVASNLGLTALQNYCIDLENKLRADPKHFVEKDTLEQLITDSLNAADYVINQECGVVAPQEI